MHSEAETGVRGRPASVHDAASRVYGVAMPQEYVPRVPPLHAALVIAGAVIAILGACATRPADGKTTSDGAVETDAKVPITTASADARALYLKGRALADRLRPHDGRLLFEQAVSLDPSFAMAHYSLAVSAPTPRVLAAELAAAVAHSGTVSEGERLMILSLQARANADPRAALEYTEQLVAKFPRDERARLALGLAYFGQQDYDRAILEFKQAIEIDSSFSPAYNMLGYAYRPVGRNEDAEAAYKKYIQLIPDDPNPYDSYAELLMKTGRFDESVAQYEKALSIDPHFPGSYLGISADRMFQGQPGKALAEAQRLYDAARDDGDRRAALFAQAIVSVDAGDTEHALQRLAQEYALDATIADTMAMSADAVALGDVLLDAGKPDAARARYAEALDLVMASSRSDAVKDDATLADRYNRARVALAERDRRTAEAEAKVYASGAQAKHNAVRIRQSHELAGLIELDAQKFDLAETELRQADQQNPFVLYALARAYEGAGDASTALTLATAAANANTLPTLPYAFIRMKAMMKATKMATRRPSSS
jgi:tetratricopeptide (TPR) repeat protein